MKIIMFTIYVKNHTCTSEAICGLFLHHVVSLVAVHMAVSSGCLLIRKTELQNYESKPG